VTDAALSGYRRPKGVGLVSAYAAAGAGIFRRDASIRWTYRGSLVSENAGIIFTLALFYYLSKLIRVAPFHTPEEYFSFAVVGIVIFGIVRSSVTIPNGVRQELVAGTYERLVLSPFGGTAAVVSLIVFPLLYSLAVATLELAVAVVLFGLHIEWHTAALAVPIGIAGALAFAPLALLFAAVTLAFKQAPGQNTSLAVISLASGMYFPVALLPSWLRWISEVQPFTPAVDLLRHVLIGFPLTESPASAIAKLVGFIVIGIPIGVRLVSLAGWYGRKRGTIVEY
jgi:ABC-2 type transport system permease protein